MIIILFSIGIGYIYGYFYSKYNSKDLPTKEMKSRSESSGLIEGILIVASCAFAFPWASKNADITTLIAIGIATSLLPPLVNIGLVSGSYKAAPENYKETHWLGKSKKYGFLIFGINALGLIIGSIIYAITNC